MSSIDRNGHDAVLARIAELETLNARLLRENEALRAGKYPESTEVEPGFWPFNTTKAQDWIVVVVVLLLLVLVQLLKRGA